MIRMVLGIGSLTLMWFLCGTGNAQPKDAALPKGAPRSVSGHGEKVENAQRAALSKAVDEIVNLMKANHLTSFKVTEEYVRKNVLVDAGQAGKDLDALPGADPFKAWVVTFRTDSDWWQDLQRRDHEAKRQRVAESRQNLGSQVIISLGLLLLAGVGYVRLDEYTQRRYTTLLRLGGVSVAATMAAGWWMFLQAPG